MSLISLFGFCSKIHITAHMLTLKELYVFYSLVVTSLCHSSVLLVFKINRQFYSYLTVLFKRTMLTCFDFKHSDFVSFMEFLVSNISRKVAWSECETCFWSQKRAATLQCVWQGWSFLYLLPRLWRHISVALINTQENGRE